MAIEINDLPQLKDLTPEQLKELFGAGPLGFKPSFEQLEDRRVMSGFSSLLSATAVSAPISEKSPPVASYAAPIDQLIPADAVALQTQTTPFAALIEDGMVVVGTNQQKDSGLAYITEGFTESAQSVLSNDLYGDAFKVGKTIDWASAFGTDDPFVDYGKSIYDGAGLPILNSLHGAPANLYLNFTGDFQANWSYYDYHVQADGSITSGDRYDYQNIKTGAYDSDGNQNRLSSTEAAEIREIWARVAEDYAPFNLNVTTVKPAVTDDGWTLTVNIGDSNGWYNSKAPADEQLIGISNFVGAFSDNVPDVAFVFTDAITRSPFLQSADFVANVADAASHEAGHIFGLAHHLTPSSDLDPGRDDQGPIMGSLTTGTRKTWGLGIIDYVGKDNRPILQWDIGKIAGEANGFGYQADDVGDDFAHAKALSFNLTEVATVKGIVGIHPPEGFECLLGKPDVDVFSFTTTGGAVIVLADVLGLGYKNAANLMARVELWSDNGMVASAGPDGRANAVLAANVAAGTYYLKVMSGGGLTDIGEYTLRVGAPVNVTLVGKEKNDYLGSIFGTKGFAADEYVAFVRFQAASAPEQLQARLLKLDEDVALNQSQLQTVLDTQVQFAAERERLEASLQSPFADDAPDLDLLELHVSAARIEAALEQNQEAIALLQSQLDFLEGERAFIGSALAETEAAPFAEPEDVEFVAGDPVEAAPGDTNLPDGELGEVPTTPAQSPEELQSRLAVLNQDLEQRQQELSAALESQAQITAENERLQLASQAASEALAAADLGLASKSDALAAAMASFNQSNQSALGWQIKYARKQELQAKVTAANTAYQQALQAAKANHKPALVAQFTKATKAAKATLDAAKKELTAQTTAVTAAEKLMKADATKRQKATAALALAQQAFDAANQVRDQAAQDLADVQASQDQSAAVVGQGAQQIADLQARVDELSAQEAEIAATLAEAEHAVSGAFA